MRDVTIPNKQKARGVLFCFGCFLVHEARSNSEFSQHVLFATGGSIAIVSWPRRSFYVMGAVKNKQ